jgi:DNA-binding response OmpR family regulator
MRDILIVEDGLHERERLKRLFGAAHYTVDSAETVAEAEKLLAMDQFRLVVLDIGLGDKSGSFLFERLKNLPRVPYVIILTGNPSIHLKQRFLDEGAAAYIVKASPAAGNDSLLATISSLLGSPQFETVTGIPLEDFLRQYISEQSRQLFLDAAMQIPQCKHCGKSSYVVSFLHKTQLPPVIEGRVICTNCSREMDLEIG